MAVCADDFLVAEETQVEAVFSAIKAKWIAQIRKWCGQEGYLAEMLQRRKVVGTENQPCPRIEEGEEEDPKRPEKIKEAQGLVGEAKWLSGRTRLTRPKISFMTGLMSPMLRPEYTFKLGTLLKYLVADPSQRTLKPSRC